MAMNKVSIPVIILSIALFTASAMAQKLPNMQESSLRAPANIKVDGKPTEWNNQFQAYNKATEIFYTISNDNDKLYLSVKAKDLDIINKIICGGITLTINGSGKTKDKDGMSITYPALNKNSFRRAVLPVDFDSPFIGVRGTSISTKQADSLTDIINKRLISKATDIAIAGIKGITDTISIYNPENIKASALFDNEKNLTYELAVPLKSLGLSVTDSKPLVYNIKLNGFNPDTGSEASMSMAVAIQRAELRANLRAIFQFGLTLRPGVRLIDPNLVFKEYPMKDGIYILADKSAPRVVQMISPTDFWGEYNLAKK